MPKSGSGISVSSAETCVFYFTFSFLFSVVFCLKNVVN